MAKVTVVETNGSAIVREYETDERAFKAYDANRQVPRTEYVQMTYNSGRVLRWLNPSIGAATTKGRAG